MKLTARIISAAMAAAMLTLNISAAKPAVYGGEVKNYYGAVSTDLNREAYNAIKNAATEYRDSVSLAAYNISTSQIGELYNAVIRDNPSLFYLANSYKYMPSGSIVSSLLLSYDIPKDQLSAAIAEYDRMIEKIIRSVPAGLDDIGKTLYIHDYMATHFEYDVKDADHKDEPHIYDAYTMLREGRGVCQAYTNLFIALMDKLGVDSSWAASEEGNHTWNVVKIDGNWYHVDVTHDDPLSDRYGLVRHSMFLVSDKTMLAKYSDMQCAFPCTDSRYENAGWLNTSSPLAYANGKWYGLYENGLYEVDIKNDALTQITSEYNLWELWGKPGWYYQSFFSGLVSIGGALYYNSSTQILRYDLATGEKTVVYTPDTSEGYIFGLAYDGKSIIYNITTEPGGEPNLGSYTVIPEFIRGDIDGDERLTTVDVLLLKRSLAGLMELSEIQMLAADADNDGSVNSVDILIIKRAIAGLMVLPD